MPIQGGRRWLPVAALSCSMLLAASHKRKSTPAGSPGDFDYYLLSMSWAPDFCAQPNVTKNDRECGAGRHVGFVVHGLWPQAATGRSPEQCAPASPVSQDIVNQMLAYIPSASLIQHEWKTHGTCSGLGVSQYFDNVRKAFDSVKIPPDLRALNSRIEVSPGDIANKFAAANPSFPKTAFRISCKSNELQEARVCFTKDLQPRACTDSAGECPVGRIAMRPVQ